MFKSYFTECEAEVQELEQMTKQFKYELDRVSQEIKDLERLFSMNLMDHYYFYTDDFILRYEDGKIYYTDDPESNESRLIETKYQVRMKVAPFLPDFARAIVNKHKQRLRDEGYST